MNNNAGRSGVLLRLVTRGIEQKDMMYYLKKQARFKTDLSAKLVRAEFPVNGGTNEEEAVGMDEGQILHQVREEVLQGAYYLIDYRGYAGYEPGDNVVNIFAMGAMVTEGIKASETLLGHGIYANVIAVTSPDLLAGIQAHENDYTYLKHGLGINSDLYLRKSEDVSAGDLITVAGKRVPMVSVHDGEAGLLDNLGSIIGVRHEACAVRKHSKCGRPSEIYAFHGIDAKSVVEACGKVLAETALEQVIVRDVALEQTQQAGKTTSHWTELWPTKNPMNKH
jgi:pyruvate dehydrogenase E1 component